MGWSAYAFAAGSAGALLGWIVGQLPPMFWLSQEARRIVAATMLLLLAARECGLVRLPIPELKLRVPPSAVKGPRWRAGLIWGTVLGLGCVTFIRFGAYYAMYVVIAVIGSPSAGAMIGFVYGISRTSPVAATLVAPTLRGFLLSPNSGRVLSYEGRARALGASVMLVGAGLFVYSI